MMKSSIKNAGVLRPATVWIGLLACCYLAILPMSGTIALRNVLLLTLLILVIWALPKIWREMSLGLPVLVWTIYLCLFPIFSEDHSIAWQSLVGQWGPGVLAMLVGAGVATLIKRKVSLFYFGVASSVPLLVHLFLFATEAWHTSSMPWGYWGREAHHADLGYAAGHTMLFMSAVVVAGDHKFRAWAIALGILALLSTLFASSRAGLMFGLLAGVFVLGAAYLCADRVNRRRIAFGLIGIFLLGAIILGVAAKSDPRWSRLAAQLPTAWQGNAIEVECRGVSEADSETAIGPEEERTRQVKQPVTHWGDASRIFLLRAGFELAIQYPWGADGSKQAYQKRLQEVCPVPAHLMAHTHNGWLDTTLALGWIGSFLYLFILINFLMRGVDYLRAERVETQWALVLVATSLFWIVRGLTDSVFRDHMLEMQGFVLAYAAVEVERARRGSMRAAEEAGSGA